MPVFVSAAEIQSIKNKKMNKSVTNIQNKIEKEAEDMFDISQKKMIENEKKVLKS